MNFLRLFVPPPCKPSSLQCQDFGGRAFGYESVGDDAGHPLLVGWGKPMLAILSHVPRIRNLPIMNWHNVAISLRDCRKLISLVCTPALMPLPLVERFRVPTKSKDWCFTVAAAQTFCPFLEIGNTKFCIRYATISCVVRPSTGIVRCCEYCTPSHFSLDKKVIRSFFGTFASSSRFVASSICWICL